MAQIRPTQLIKALLRENDFSDKKVQEMALKCGLFLGYSPEETQERIREFQRLQNQMNKNASLDDEDYADPNELVALASEEDIDIIDESDPFSIPNARARSKTDMTGFLSDIRKIASDDPDDGPHERYHGFGNVGYNPEAMYQRGRK